MNCKRWCAILLFCTHSEVPLVISRRTVSSDTGESDTLRKSSGSHALSSGSYRVNNNAVVYLLRV
jgi:hypothetical protein